MKRSKKLHPARYVVMGFIAVILIGTLLLMTPIAQRPEVHIGFIDSLFTATSAVCVTGLVTIDTWTAWTLFGRIVILSLIQIGGLGFMSIATLIPLIFGRKINLKDRLILKEQFNQQKLQGIVALLKQVFKLTFIIEAMGAVFLSLDFIPRFGLTKGVSFSIFHSISAFCNAGFDLFGGYSGKYSSLIAFNNSPIVILTISIMIILGGIGFPVILNIMGYIKNGDSLNLLTKLALTTTTVLIISGTFIILTLEFNNSKTIGQMSFGYKLLNSFMQSVTTRTAGFSSVDLSNLREGTLLIMIILMFIGASPASTGGGIKTVTFAVLILSLRGVINDRQELTIFHRRLPKNTLPKALAIFTLASMTIILATFLLVTIEPEFNLLQSIFEAASALATVGCSIGGTPNLTKLSKLIITTLMFAGRVGLATILISTSSNSLNKYAKVRYPEERVLIG